MYRRFNDIRFCLLFVLCIHIYSNPGCVFYDFHSPFSSSQNKNPKRMYIEFLFLWFVVQNKSVAIRLNAYDVFPTSVFLCVCVQSIAPDIHLNRKYMWISMWYICLGYFTDHSHANNFFFAYSVNGYVIDVAVFCCCVCVRIFPLFFLILLVHWSTLSNRYK